MEVLLRVLFEFVAENSSELSITPGETLIRTSGVDGDDWWYAQNSSGQTGAIPASYVEIINEENSVYQALSEANYQPRLEEERQQSTEYDLAPDSSFDSLGSPLMTVTSTQLCDPYKTIMDQQYSLLGDVVASTAMVVNNDNTYDTTATILIPINSYETNTGQSMAENISLSPTNVDLNTTQPKQEKSKLFSLKRPKSKGDNEKRRPSVDNGLEGMKEDSDSDDLNDSLSNSNKHSSGGGDSKITSRAKFFDKHGVGHYLLNECKTKSDEHVEIRYDAGEGGVCWATNPSLPPFTCKIENPSKESKFSGLKTFVEYKIHPQIPDSRVVGRRYKQFDWLYEQLAIRYRFICIPPLPGKHIAGRFDQEFIEERRRQLELWLNRICHHPILCASFPVQHFITCEITEKNNKDWKIGKRKVEKDEFRESAWLYCVTSIDSKLSDTEIATQIDRFACQQPGFDTHLKHLNLNFTKYLERHTEVYERDLHRVSELFTKLHLVVDADKTTPGNEELAQLMTKVSSSYSGIAELYKTKGYEGIRDFVERVQEYIGLLSCFPIIINIQRSATEYVRNAQRNPTTTADLNGAIHRNQILHYVVLAEINFFQKEKVKDLKSYMKLLLDEQIQFYEKVTSELRDAISPFE